MERERIETVLENLEWRLNVDHLLERLSDDVRDLKAQGVTRDQITFIREKLQDVPTRANVQELLLMIRSTLDKEQKTGLDKCQDKHEQQHDELWGAITELREKWEGEAEKIRKSQKEESTLAATDRANLRSLIGDLRVEIGKLSVKTYIFAAAIGSILGVGSALLIPRVLQWFSGSP